MLFFYTAITLGFLGSFHCVGMCGPIALALPVHHFGTLKKHAGILLYQLGRLFTYSVLGLLFGVLGQTFFPAVFQQSLSIGIGALMLLVLIASRLGQAHMPDFLAFRGLIGRLKSGLSRLFHRRGLRFLFLTGLLNGLLPCGLVYIGIAGAAATSHYLHGGLFMLGFGLGTVPAMYAVPTLGQFIGTRSRNQMRKAMPVIMAAMALLLIVRGLNLGIPYLSPALEKQQHTLNCCSKTADHQNKIIITCSPNHH
jgi:sulfite exporter TauE/SafE